MWNVVNTFYKLINKINISEVKQVKKEIWTWQALYIYNTFEAVDKSVHFPPALHCM